MAGVETGEHPPSSLEGVEQPSEASGEEKLELCLLLRLTSLSGGPTECYKNSNTQFVTLQGTEVLLGGSPTQWDITRTQIGSQQKPHPTPRFRFP